MARSTSAAPPGSEFDNFLFATIEEGPGGMPLSVLSALARLNVDPWEAAANLARLPLDLATGKLTSLIATLPDGSARADLRTTVPRLLALLPSPRAAVSKVAGLTESSRVKTAIYYLVVLAIMMLGNRLWAGRHAHAPIGAGLEPVSVTVSPITSLSQATDINP